MLGKLREGVFKVGGGWVRRKSSKAANSARRGHRTRFEPLERRLVLDAAGPLLITEFMAANDRGLLDTDGETSDWIEIYNPTENAVDLEAWSLTDDADNLTKWQFPPAAIEPGDYLLVFASGKDHVDPGVELHAGFQLGDNGEYLALVRDDGVIAHEYTPEYPNQVVDVSYGLPQGTITLLSEGAEVSYRVPTPADAVLGTSWTANQFDDSGWTDSLGANPVLITEVSNGGYDWFEIQNVGGYTADTSGWFVAVNEASGEDPINNVNGIFWYLPESMGPDAVLFQTDHRSDPNWFGGNIFWGPDTGGWAMLVDDEGNVADFVVWGYTETEIGSLDVEVGEADAVQYRITAADVSWSGRAMEKNGEGWTAKRIGNSDHDDVSDFGFEFTSGSSQGGKNTGLITPFSGEGGPAPTTGLGFSAATGDFNGAIRTNLVGEMVGRNASVWMRIPFEVDNLTLPGDLELHMKYDDGFVAYLNGEEVARPNAPDSLTWNSTAVTNRPDGSASVYEVIDLAEHLDLLQTGTNVLAIHGLNDSPADEEMLILPRLTATATQLDQRYLHDPTPGSRNGQGYVDYVRDTKFSVDRGFFDDPFELEITTSTPGATIRYTTDGSEPTETNGTDYTGPMVIDKTTALRAAAFKEGCRPTNVDSQTYIFVDDVILQSRQTTLDAGFPPTWGGTTADYGMDPFVVNNRLYRDTIRDDLKSIPTMSIVMDVDDLFGPDGIYTHSTTRCPTTTEPDPPLCHWERPTSVELIYPDGSEGFQIDSGIRIQGAYFRQHSATRKHSFRLLFKHEYGPTKLEFPLFGEDAAQRFDTITLRAGANDGYSWGAAYPTEQYTRDEFGRSLQIATGNAGGHGTFVHLYINGVYWGLYNPVERPDHSFSATYYGGDKDDWDSIHDLVATNGDMIAWNQMVSLSRSAATSISAYQRLQGSNPDGTPNPNYPHLLDVPNYIDYLVVNVWGGNWDWPWKNWWAARDRTENSTGFKFYSWDYENTIGNNRSRSPLNKNALQNNFSQAGEPHQNLKQNAEYRMEFADRVHRLFFNDGVLTPDPLIARYSELASQVERAMVGESARWGDQQSHATGTLAQWYTERNWILGTYLPQRSEIVLDQLKAAGLYPRIDSVEYSQHGGVVPTGYSLVMSAPPGTIYYTLDGSDPRAIGGSRSGTAVQYTGAAIPLTETSVVKARVRSGNTWSALNEAEFFVAVPAAADNFTITELNYNPYEPTQAELDTQSEDETPFQNDDFEFVELRNTSDRPIDLRGVRFTDGITFDFSDGTVTQLEPGEAVVVVRSTQAFEARYGTEINVAGSYGESDTNFRNGGEQVALSDHLGTSIVTFGYDDSGRWPGRADGKGSSLEVIDTAGDFDDGNNWRSSGEYGGTPGSRGEGIRGDVVATEILSNSEAPGAVDWFELHNTTGQEIDLGGWVLSDSSDNYRKYEILAGTILPAGGYLVFDESHFNPNPGAPGPNDFALSGDRGDDVWLLEVDASGRLTRFVEHAEFPAAAEDEAWGRWPDAAGVLYPMIRPTPNEANSGPRVGPVILSEIMYHPIGPDGTLHPDSFEFVEICNASARTVDLKDWRIRGGVDFDFADDATLAAGATMVVVPFDLSDSARLDEFRAHYGIDDAPVDIAGPFSGKLENVGERIRLQRPGTPPEDEQDFIPRLLEDEVVYGSVDPWPTEPNGGGQSLQRLGARSWGHDVASWTAAAPTSGSFDAAGYPGDANFDGMTDVRDFNIWNAHKFTSDTNWFTGDFDGDGITDVRDFNIWNAHKFTSAPTPARVDAVLAKPAGVELPDGETLPSGLFWLQEYQSSGTRSQSSEEPSSTEAAVDRLLASYWR